jgi:signal transduction histidine kinase/ActR/RegA family two-component response regulator
MENILQGMPPATLLVHKFPAKSNNKAMIFKSNIEAIKNAPSQLTAGFFMFITLIILLMVLWVNNLSENKSLVLQMAEESTDAHSISEMLNSVHKQALAIKEFKNASTHEGKRDSYSRFIYIANNFSKVAHTLSSKPSQKEKAEIWKDVNQYLARFDTIIKQAETLDTDNKQDGAYQLLLNNYDFIHDKMMSSVSLLISNDLLGQSRENVDNIVSKVSAENETTYMLLFFLGWITFFLGAFMMSMIKRTVKSEAAALEQGERLRDLYEATSISGISHEEKILETLRLGCKVLGMEIGKVGRQDPVENTSTFINFVAPPEIPAKKGTVLPLDKTFCNLTFLSEGPIAFHHVTKSKYKDHPATSFLGMEAYIGTTIFVNDKKYGTVNFSNRKPRQNPFTKADIDFVNIIGKWISVTMEQQMSEEALQAAKKDAETANHAKSTFLANMSHEIRTPLTAILGYSEMLLEDDEDKTDEDRKHEIKSIMKSGSHLHEIINDILDLSKIEAGQLVIEEIDIPTTGPFDEIESIFKSRSKEKGLTFTTHYNFPLPEKIMTDPTRLKQILINLCGNAIKFTKKGGVTIDVSYLNEEQLLEVRVQDTGIGMGEEEMACIFRPFSQADDSITRKFGGTGLGLCISKQLAQKMGGDVTVESKKGEGSTFTVTIKARIPVGHLGLMKEKSTPAERNIEAVLVPTQLQGHVLLAEDIPENQKLITKYLMRTGLTVDIADNGQIALDMADRVKYDLIVMDVQMPVMGGLEATKELRQKGINIPIICITANAMREDKQRCLEAGADKYFTKPIDLRRLYSALTYYLKPGNVDPDTNESRLSAQNN